MARSGPAGSRVRDVRGDAVCRVFAASDSIGDAAIGLIRPKWTELDLRVSINFPCDMRDAATGRPSFENP
jgi:hypothetical protein